MENKDYLQRQIITYIGNKRQLLPLITHGINNVRNDLKQDKISFLDLFSGSGVVSRYAKQFSHTIIANDLEYYSYVINDCYLSNKEELDHDQIMYYYQMLKSKENDIHEGFISKNYAPIDDHDIQIGERVFYTRRNAIYLDNMINNIHQEIPLSYQKYFIAPLLAEASIHVNTAGVFKGFYKDGDGRGAFGAKGKNALSRIMADIYLPFPVFSKYSTTNHIYQKDANELIKSLSQVDICYLDPPYNQHPYGSNYFMLNAIAKNHLAKEISKVSGIPINWRRSKYNSRKQFGNQLEDIISNVKARYVLLSFNNEGFLTRNEIEIILKRYGNLKILKANYNTYRGARNLKNRSIHVKEYLFVLKKFDKFQIF
ncbi:MAG: DNA adenine methylase [Erysipelotrichaceae bacterium]|nr:DNA adenine methylase [Erysipelotrichaceae bacterium]MDD4642824.1 DNA adenine methylase [Erysipelotrichaceae bacterium]